MGYSVEKLLCGREQSYEVTLLSRLLINPISSQLDFPLLSAEIFFLFFKKKDFIYLRESERERECKQREGQRERKNQTLC